MISQQPEFKKTCGSRQERETVIRLNPMRKDALLLSQILNGGTFCEGAMGDQECGGTHRQSSDLLQRQPVQKIKKTYIPLADQILRETSEATAYRGEMGDRECGETHKQSSDLLQEQSDQTVRNTFICSHCGKILISCGDPQIHERIHTEEKPYWCPECEKSFYTKGKLVRHQQVTHELQFSPLFPEAEVQLVSEQESHPVNGTQQNHLTAPLSGESRGIISQQFENEEASGSQQGQETMKFDRKDALLHNKVLSETTFQGREASGSRPEREIVPGLIPTRKDALLAGQVLDAVTSCGGEMSNREHGGMHRKSSDLLQRQPDQKIKKTYIPLVDQFLSEAASCGGEMGDREHGETPRQSSDHSPWLPIGKVKKNYICLYCGKFFRSRRGQHFHIHSVLD